MRFDPALVHFRLVHSSQREARPGQECVRGPQAFQVRASLVEGYLSFGQGGFQSLLRQIQRKVNGNVLVLTPALIERIAYYVRAYGNGGFQGRLDVVLSELAVLPRLLEPIAA